MKFVKNPIGERVKTERAKAQLSQSELAHAIGITQKALSQIETGISSPRRTTIYAIEGALRLPRGTLWAQPQPATKPSLKQLRALVHAQGAEAPYALLAPVLERFLGESAEVRAAALAILYGDSSIARLGDEADMANSR